MDSQNEFLKGFDESSGKVWIYPTNFAIRSYQYNIVEKCLYKNTMVVLPTGKSFSKYDSHSIFF